MKKLDNTFFDKLKLSIDDLIDDEQLSIGRVSHPFTVPPTYFSELRVSVNRAVDALEVKRWVFKFERKSVWYSAAAIFIFAMIGTGLFFEKDTSVSVNQLSQDDIVAFLEIQPMSMTEISTNAGFTDDELTDIELSSFPLSAEDIELGNTNAMLIYEIEKL